MAHNRFRKMINERCLVLKNLACNMTTRQYFSILWMSGKQFEPPIFNALIQDIGGQDLHGKISELLGKSYLSLLKQDQEEYAEIRTGIFYGSGRGIITIPTRAMDKNPIWIHYLINTEAPYTYLSKQALDPLKLDRTQNSYRVFINKQVNQVRLSSTHFAKVNLLGIDFLENRASLSYDMYKKKITLTDNFNQNYVR